MASEISHGEFNDRINNASVKPTRLSLLLCASSRFFQKLARWHTRRTVARQARQELHDLSDATLKDIGLRRGDINNLADNLANRAQPCP
jgi:uncharacterized protein YjiS (DUF1127 family)